MLNIKNDGWLKDNVSLEEDLDLQRLKYSHWEMSIPSNFINMHQPLKEVLQRTRSLKSLPKNAHYDDLISLFKMQGLFTPQLTKPIYTMRELRDIFDPLKSCWYATYYSHPLWTRLRQGNASRNELVAWFIHNYHISRAAGIVGARFVGKSQNEVWRAFFVKDTLEEYWHCDAFYFVRHEKLKIEDRDVKDYVPLPSSLAFEQHTLQLAERDPVGHLLVAYMQESTIEFYDDCLRFYNDVETQYQIPGFFDLWAKHMRIDMEHGHATGLSALFDSNQEFTSEQIQKSLNNAWLGCFYLCLALDEISALGNVSDEISLRLPGKFNTVVNRRAFNVNEITSLVKGDMRVTVLDVCKKCIAQVGICFEGFGQKVSSNIENDFSCLEALICESLFSALSNSITHDDIVMVGNICKLLPSAVNLMQTEFPSFRAVAIANFLRESASDIEITISCLLILQEILGKSEAFARLQGPWVTRAEIFLKGRVANERVAFLVNRMAQFIEIVAFYHRNSCAFELEKPII